MENITSMHFGCFLGWGNWFLPPEDNFPKKVIGSHTLGKINKQANKQTHRSWGKGTHILAWIREMKDRHPSLNSNHLGCFPVTLSLI